MVNPKLFSCNYAFIDHLPLVVKQLGSESMGHLVTNDSDQLWFVGFAL